MDGELPDDEVVRREANEVPTRRTFERVRIVERPWEADAPLPGWIDGVPVTARQPVTTTLPVDNGEELVRGAQHGAVSNGGRERAGVRSVMAQRERVFQRVRDARVPGPQVPRIVQRQCLLPAGEFEVLDPPVDHLDLLGRIVTSQRQRDRRAPVFLDIHGMVRVPVTSRRVPATRDG